MPAVQGTGSPPTVFPNLNELLQELEASVESILEENFVGAYLVGSFALGGGDLQSECDFLVVTEVRVTPAQERELRELHAEIPSRTGHWPHDLEGSYAPRADLETPTSGSRSSSTSSAAALGSRPARWHSSRRCAHSSITAAIPTAALRRSSAAARTSVGTFRSRRCSGSTPWSHSTAFRATRTRTSSWPESSLSRRARAPARSATVSRRPVGAGAEALAIAVTAAAERGAAELHFAYPLDSPLERKLEAVAQKIYGADGIDLAPSAAKTAERPREAGLDDLPVCIAKTPLSFTHDPAVVGAPVGFVLPIGELRPYTGAGWIVAAAGDVMTMPGLGSEPAARRIDLDHSGRIVGVR